MSLHVASTAKPKTLTDLLVRDPEPEISRETVTVLAGSGAARELKFGMVIAKTAAGKVVQLAPAADDGTEVAVGVLLQDVTAEDGADAEGIAVTHLAAVRRAALVWPAGINATQTATALAQLAARLVIAR